MMIAARHGKPIHYFIDSVHIAGAIAEIDSANIEGSPLRFWVVTGGVALSAVWGLAIAAVVFPSWRVDASEVSPATPTQIWAWYAESARTPNWDHLVMRRMIKGPFATGTKGSNQGTGGPVFPWTLTDVQTDNHYTEMTQLFGATLTAKHVLTPAAKGTRIDHALIVAGPFAWVYRLALYSSFESGIHAALHRLAAGVGNGAPPAHRLT